MDTSNSQNERKTRFVFRVLAGVIAALLLLVGLPASTLEAIDGPLLGWLLPLCCLLAGVGMAEGARTGEWMFSHGTARTDD